MYHIFSVFVSLIYVEFITLFRAQRSRACFNRVYIDQKRPIIAQSTMAANQSDYFCSSIIYKVSVFEGEFDPIMTVKTALKYSRVSETYCLCVGHWVCAHETSEPIFANCH